MEISRLHKSDYQNAEALLKTSGLPFSDIYAENISLFEVIEKNESIAIGGFEKFGKDAIIRSIAVIQGKQLKGTGSFIVENLENIAISEGIQNFYLLTTTAKSFFEKRQYKLIDKKLVPEPIKLSTEFALLCPDTAICMIKNIGMKYVPEIINVNSNITLKQIEFSDANDVFNIIDSQRAYLGEWLPFVAHTHSIGNTRDFIQSTINLPKEQREYVFAIQFNNEIVGISGFRDTDNVNKKTEIGYWISKHFQNKGIITMCIEKLIDFAFIELELNRIQIRCATGNAKSIKIPNRFGFTFEGTERDGELFPDGSYKALKVYSLLKNE